jgi:hypothetical protein
MWDVLVVGIGRCGKLPAKPCDIDTEHNEEKSII